MTYAAAEKKQDLVFVGVDPVWMDIQLFSHCFISNPPELE